MEKFELGPLQKLWIKSLREHPERKITGCLGRGNEIEYKACCLGELHLCYHRSNDLELPFIDRQIVDDSEHTLEESYEKYGLRSHAGDFLCPPKEIGMIVAQSLTCANDNGATWIEIADFIEKNPKEVFTKSV